MADYKISNSAKNDLIRIYHYGVSKFGMNQADHYFDTIFKNIEIISQQPYAFERIDHIKTGYRRCAFGTDSIYYKIENNCVEIMAIVGRQDLNNIL